MRILIAEDERITRLSLTRQLESLGHIVTATEDGQTAWERFKAGEFDIVLTDWEMPRLSGVELIQRIREAPQSSYVYVIMLTSRSDKADLVKGIEAGADDFVCKPFDREELRVRLLAGQRIVNLERALSRQNAELRLANERIHHGLRAAARVQRSMLPQQNVITPHVRTAWKYVPTEELAGDAIGLHLIDNRYLVSYVLDVSGHGVPAALLSVTAMHSLEPLPETTSLLRDRSGSTELGSVQRPSRIAMELNRRFRADNQDGRYFTMILCVLDTHTGRLWFTSAGHPPLTVLRRQDIVAPPEAGGLPIALMDDAEYDDGVIELAPRDRILLVSDGLLEQTSSCDGEQFGQAHLLPLLMAHSSSSPEQLVARIVEDLAQWAGSPGFRDDLSLVAIDWLGP